RMMSGKTPGAVRAQLGRFGFSGVKATQKVGKLSGGERARLALALITRDAPHMLILDEPTAVLTPQESASLRATLGRLVAEGLSIIFISHKLDEVLEIGDRVVVLRGGRVAGEVAA
ncbi:ATP-binding cassette domain-containing protein, partial [Shewanella algae]|uniref:ATP-binding cassette domain-containing protein n=1 Tax=Shewanella algae TaxID=38313 RepID=UPI00313D134E